MSPDGAGEPTRTYLLGLESVRYQISGTQRWVYDDAAADAPPIETSGDEADVADEDSGVDSLAEVIVVPAHLYGVPWAEFGGSDRTPQSLPGNWLAQLQALKADVDAKGLKVILALTPTNARQDNLAPKVVADGRGGSTLQDNWLNEYCPNTASGGNPEKWPTAYARYVEWMVNLFEPDFVILARRINLFEENCGEVSPGSYGSMLGYAEKAHVALKDAGSEATTVVSVDVEDLYGYPKSPGRCPSMTPKECFDSRRSLLEPIVADRVGLASNPGSALAALQELPEDWLSHVHDGLAGKSAVITALGLPARSVEEKSGVCVPYIDSSESLQRDFLDQALGLASREEMEFIVWTASRDYFEADSVGACVCGGPKDLCDHLEQLGASADDVRPSLIQGLFDFEGNLRQAGSLWLTLLDQ